MMLNDNHFADVSKMIETPPLTAELSSNPLQLMLEWLCDNGGLDYLSITPEDIAEAASDIAKSYAAQQTAAKDARIAELELKQIGYLSYIETIEAERDALQTKLDDALAQVAMLANATRLLVNTISKFDTGSNMESSLAASLVIPSPDTIKRVLKYAEKTLKATEGLK